MLKELGFSTQIKDLTIVITYASADKLRELVEAIQKTDGGAMSFTYFNEGFRMNYDKDNYKLIIKTFKYNNDNSINFKPFCTIDLRSVEDMSLLNIKFEQPEELVMYNNSYQFIDNTSFFKVLNNTIGTTFESAGDLLL